MTEHKHEFLAEMNFAGYTQHICLICGKSKDDLEREKLGLKKETMKWVFDGENLT